MLFEIKQIDLFPVQPGVYLMKNGEKQVIYVGKAKNLRSRVKQYFQKGGDGRAMIPFLIDEIIAIDTIVVSSEKEALLLENTLIKKHQPKYNAILKDDKTFISLMINNQHPWPMIRLVRYKGKPPKKGLYFGPYTSAYAARKTFEHLTQLFPLRQCSDDELKNRTRPCLLYGIKRCIAPCVGKCTKEQYQTFVDGAIQFLSGHNKEIVEDLKRKMQAASEKLEFEKAAAFLETIRGLEQVMHYDQHVVHTSVRDCDVLGLHRQADEVMLMQLFFRDGNLVGSEHYSFSNILEDDDELISSFLLQHYKGKHPLPTEILVPCALKESAVLEEILSEGSQKKIHILHPQKGEKRTLTSLAEKNAIAAFKQEKDESELQEKMLLDLQETLHLNRYPERIECFDTSNLSGSDLVAAMTAFTDGKLDRNRSRVYKIRDILKGDDYGALHQVLTRRLMRAKDENDLPDLIIVDGGKGQLNVALNVFKELDIASVDVISIAKEEGRHDKGMTKERVFIPHQSDPVQLPIHSPLILLLQRIRDATHDKAIGYHRKRRKTRILTTQALSIPGIGPIKSKRLLQHFGSLKRVRAASDEELASVKGINKRDVAAIRSWHSEK